MPSNTLFLCKMNPENPINGEARFVAIVGRIVEQRGGYRFLPNVSGRTPSRKVWADPLKTIPRWADKIGFCRLLDKQELDAHALLSERADG